MSALTWARRVSWMLVALNWLLAMANFVVLLAGKGEVINVVALGFSVFAAMVLTLSLEMSR